MSECVECGAFVDPKYARVRGDNQNRVECRECNSDWFDRTLRSPGQLRDKV